MNEYIERARAFVKAQLDKRSARERWILVGAAAALFTVLVEVILVSPLRDAVAETQDQAERLESDLQLAVRMVPQIQRLRSEIGVVESRIQTGRQTDLLRLLDQLATQAKMREQLESVRPRTPSKNPKYPESRVEVQLRGATLAQTVQFLYSIETADLYLIVRSVSVKARPDPEAGTLLDVNFSVSSFERA